MKIHRLILLAVLVAKAPRATSGVIDGTSRAVAGSLAHAAAQVFDRIAEVNSR
jgi:hypothetical protein